MMMKSVTAEKSMKSKPEAELRDLGPEKFCVVLIPDTFWPVFEQNGGGWRSLGSFNKQHELSSMQIVLENLMLRVKAGQ